MIYTFYSFKGGVGRSMALSNIAEIFRQRGLDVLVIDFDLEAPGLERFFDFPGALTSQDEILAARGVFDYMFSYKALREVMPRQEQAVGSFTTLDEALTSAILPSASDSARFEDVRKFIVPIYRRGDQLGSLDLMPAGRREGAQYSIYAERVRSFNWDEFYTEWDGEQFFSSFALALKNVAHVILIDSRTGLTEMSGVCTHQLADVVVLLTAANRQNIEGTRRIAQSLVAPAFLEFRKRPLSLLPVPSRVEGGEGDKHDRFAKNFAAQLSPFIAHDRLKFQTSPFVDLRLPYVQYYAYEEDVAVRNDPDGPKSVDLIAAYTRVASAMVELAPAGSAIPTIYYSKGAVSSHKAGWTFPPAPKPFVGRLWAIEQYLQWLKSREQLLLITGPPGSGKTALASRLVELSRDPVAFPHELRGNITFAYTYSPQTTLEPSGFIVALARSLADRSQAYARALIRAASGSESLGVLVRSEPRIGANEKEAQYAGVSVDIAEFGKLSASVALTDLVIRPLMQLSESKDEEQFIVLLDELDAAPTGEEQTALSVLMSRIGNGLLPSCLRIVIVTRPDGRITEALFNTKIDLGTSTPQTVDDIRNYLDERLAGVPKPAHNILLDDLAFRAGNSILFAKLAADELSAAGKEPAAILKAADSLNVNVLPAGLSDLYRTLLLRLADFNTSAWSLRFRPILGALTVAQGNGLTLRDLGTVTERSRTEVVATVEALRPVVSGTLPEGPFRLFHSSLDAFVLSDEQLGISAADAHEAIALALSAANEGAWEYCQDEYSFEFLPLHFVQGVRLSAERSQKRRLIAGLASLAADSDFRKGVTARKRGAELERYLSEMLEIARNNSLADEKTINGLQTALTAQLTDGYDDTINSSGKLTGRTSLALSSGEAQVAVRSIAPSLFPLHAMYVLQEGQQAGRIWLLCVGLLCGIADALAISAPLQEQLIKMGIIKTFGLMLYGVVTVLGALSIVAVVYAIANEVRKAGAAERSDDEPGGWSRGLPLESPTSRVPTRAVRGYRIMGDLYLGSPYFEITTLILLISIVVMSFSPYTSPLR